MNQPITGEWLKFAGFRWNQPNLPRDESKHWTLWLGMPGFMASVEDLGIELSQSRGDDWWFCWLRSDFSHRYSRFMHIRHLRTTDEVVHLVEALTGKPWEVSHHWYGHVCTPEQAQRNAQEHARIEERMTRTAHLEGLNEEPF